MSTTPKIEYWKEGANARVRNVSRDECPHSKSRPGARAAWLEGWEDADKFAFLMSYVAPVERTLQ